MTSTKELPKNATVYSYLRFSTKEQRHGRSTARQTKLAKDWAEAHGYTLSDTRAFADVGVSAFKGRNATEGNLRRFVAAIESGAVEPGSILIVESLDRLSRQDVNLAVELLLSIINRGVIVVTLSDGAIYRAGVQSQAMFAQLLMSVAIFLRANDESTMKSKRKADVWSAYRQAAARGEYHGGKVPLWIEVVGKGYRVIESKAQVVRDIFRDYAHNGYGLARLSAKHKVPPATVGYWLDNPVVVGTLTVVEAGAEVRIPNHYPAIVDQRTYDLAQQRRAERYVIRRPARTDAYVNLVQGLLFDPAGLSMIAAQHNGGTRNHISRGYLVRSATLEEMLAILLAGKLMKTTDVQAGKIANPKQLEKLEADIRQLQATMAEEPELAAGLIPALRKLQSRKRDLVGEKVVVREKVDYALINAMLSHSADREQRLQLQSLIRQNVQAINLTTVDGNPVRTIKGTLTLTDGVKLPFAYAYHTWRHGIVVLGPDGLTDRDAKALAAMPKTKAVANGQPVKVIQMQPYTPAEKPRGRTQPATSR